MDPECHFDPKCCSIKRSGGLRPVTSPPPLQASSPMFQQFHSSFSVILSSVFEHFHVSQRLSYRLICSKTSGHWTDFWPKMGGQSICGAPCERISASVNVHNSGYTYLVYRMLTLVARPDQPLSVALVLLLTLGMGKQKHGGSPLLSHIPQCPRGPESLD